VNNTSHILSLLEKAPEACPWQRWAAAAGGLSLCAALYFYRVNKPFDGAEAYSALAASANTFYGSILVALEYDPGKPPLYHLLLHLYSLGFGWSEASLRAFSGLWAIAAVVLTYFLGCELFDSATAVCAAAMWAVNPLTFFLARWARMYTMFIALTVAFFLLLARLRHRPASRRLAVELGVIAALLLYTHLLAVLFVGIAFVVLLRDAIVGRASAAPWVALAAALIAFSPFIPIELRQGHELLTTHWMDYLGGLSRHSLPVRVLALTAAMALAAWLLAQPRRETRNEALRFCAIWFLLPIAAMACGSVVIRPMFEVRYLSPVGPAGALLLAAWLAGWGSRARNLATTAVVGLSIATFIPYMQIIADPWPQVAQLVSRYPAQPVIFEKGLIVVRDRARADTSAAAFSQGYYRAVFDYYSRGPNPRLTIDPGTLGTACSTLVGAVTRASGGWLVAGSRQHASDLIGAAGLRVEKTIRGPNMITYWLAPSLSRGRNDGCVVATKAR